MKSRIPNPNKPPGSGTTKLRRKKPYGKDWRQISQEIKQRDRCCQKCGAREGLIVHHIIPVSKGGTNRPVNLITLCQACHKLQPKHRHLQ